MRRIPGTGPVLSMGLFLTACGGIAEGQEGAATYEVVFETLWSSDTHPTDYPPAAHFSGLVTVAHDESVSFWEPGGLASEGIEELAELGSPTAMVGEINVAVGTGAARPAVLEPGVFVPGAVTVQFGATESHPLVTIVTMIAPSPDWFVGVHGLNLRDAQGDWREEIIVDLDPYDSGTDSGPTFLSANDDTQPAEPIANIADSFPFTGTPPIARFTFTLISAPGPAIPAAGTYGLAALALLVAIAGTGILRERSPIRQPRAVSGRRPIRRGIGLHSQPSNFSK